MTRSNSLCSHQRRRWDQTRLPTERIALRRSPMISISNPLVGRRQRRRHIAQRQGVADAVPEGARSDPADGFAVVPDRFIADRIGVRRLHPEASTAAARRRCSFSAAAAARPMKSSFLEVDEAPEARLEGTVDGPVLPRPRAEALFDAHGIERAAAEELEPDARGRP